MSRFGFWQAWLVAVSSAMAVFGIFMALFGATPLFNAFNQQIDPGFWGSAAPPASFVAFRSWIYAVWGATVASLGLLVALVAYSAFHTRATWVRNSLTACLVVWYALDTGASLAWGVTFNAVFNTVVLFFLAAPLAMTWRRFAESPGVPPP
jgi:hypothetical protein